MALATKTGVVIEYDVAVPMADGTILAADVFRPAPAGRYPVILVRTPYGKLVWPMGLAMIGADPLALARDGYVVVIQDARGTGASKGNFRALSEERDGADSVAWAAAQPWSSAAVGMAGLSYMGATQLLAAVAAPPALRAIVPFVAATPDVIYQGGAFQLGHFLPWCIGRAQEQLIRDQLAGRDVEAARTQLEDASADMAAAYRRLPLEWLANITPWLDATYGEWLGHPQANDFWTSERSAKVTTPGLHIAGWNDYLLHQSLAAFTALRAGAATEEARANQRLIVTPSHHGAPGEYVGELWYGPDAIIDLYGTHLDWFNTWLKGETPADRRGAVKLFVQGANRWREEAEWPLTRALPTRWYLRAGGGLSRDSPGDEMPDQFTYDPADPVPTTSGQTGLSGRDGAFSWGPRDRRLVQTRPDVLLYTSDVLDTDVEVTGPVTVTLHIATSARDTDFTAVLIDIHPDGRAIGLTDGILRLRYRHGFDRAQLLEPGRAYEIEIDLVATSNVFRAGHRLAVEVSSSNFPRFDRNPNHGGVIAQATESDFVTAVQQVFHDSNRGSYITLPIVPR